ncbi:hypothetical protein BH10PSE7_BH10PSE7_24470 [soil metagenome]
MEIFTMLKVLTIAVAGLLTLVTVRRAMEAMRARVQVKTDDTVRHRGVTRLRQDPRTGVYYPEQ